MNVPIGIVALVGARWRLTESYGESAKVDVPALVLVSAGVSGLIWGLIQGSQSGWSSPWSVLGLTLGAACLIGFVFWERRAVEPMVPLQLFGTGTFSAAAGAQFLMAAAIFSAAFLTSQYFQFARGYSPLQAGLRFLPWTATPLVVAPIAGALSDRIGARALIVPGAHHAGDRLRVDRLALRFVRRLSDLRDPLHHRRSGHLHVVAERDRERSQRGDPEPAGKGRRHPQHHATVRSGLRHCGHHRRVQRTREPRRSHRR